MLRIGLLAYNTADEIDGLLDAMDDINAPPGSGCRTAESGCPLRSAHPKRFVLRLRSVSA